MKTEAGASFDLAAAAARHRELLALAAETRADDVQAVLNLGAAVLLHGLFEPGHLERVRRLLDPAVLCDLDQEHESLGRDLAFLRELHGEEPSANDVQLLSTAILGRLREHLLRDERTLYRPLERLAQGHGSGDGEAQ